MTEMVLPQPSRLGGTPSEPEQELRVGKEGGYREAR